MSESPAKLRRKIGSATDLQSVVRAMKSQAAANVGQYVKSVAALADYASSVELGLGVCFRQLPRATTTRFAITSPRGGVIHAVVFGSDQGLVGRFNETVFEHMRGALAVLPPGSKVWAVGERMQATLADGGMPPDAGFPVPATVQSIGGLVSDILLAVVGTTADSARPGPASELHLFYNRPTTGSAYLPVSQQLLPLDEAWRQDLACRLWPTPLLPEVVGNLASTISSLISEYLFVSIFRASAESLASENASRLAAMDRADRNIDKMLVVLHEKFHRQRQGQIDEELSDVISGFKALTRKISP